MNNELIEHDRVKQRRSIQNRLNDFGIEEVPLPPPPPMLVRSQIYRGKIYDDEKQLIGQRVLCSWGPFDEQEPGTVNLQSGILKKIDFVNGKKYYYVYQDFKDDGRKIVKRTMDFPAEHVRIEATDSIVYPSTRDSSGHITEIEQPWETEKKEREESLQAWRISAAKERGEYIGPLLSLSEDRVGGKKRKTYKKHKKYKKTKKYRKTKKHRKTRR